MPQLDPPPYYRYNLRNMRSLAYELQTKPAGSGLAAIFLAWVPAGSWANGKAILIRGIWEMDQTLPPGPANYNVQESINIQGFTAVMPGAPGAFPTAVNTSTRFIERVFIRHDPDILFFDRGVNMVESFVNEGTALQLVGTLTPGGGSFDYTIPFPIVLNFDLTVPYPGMSLTGIWAEAFLEQGTNLGTLA